MKRTFKLDHPKIKVPRLVDSIKHDLRKFLKKERQKALPEDANYWGFDCKLGESEEAAVEVHISSLTKEIDQLVASSVMTIYVEITPKAVYANQASEAFENTQPAEATDTDENSAEQED